MIRTFTKIIRMPFTFHWRTQYFSVDVQRPFVFLRLTACVTAWQQMSSKAKRKPLGSAPLPTSAGAVPHLLPFAEGDDYTGRTLS